jgi:hypothetical protein
VQNISMAPFELKHNSETKHSEHRGTPLSFFQRILNSLLSMKAYMHTKFKYENKNVLMAYTEMCDHIALDGEVHAIIQQHNSEKN